MNLKANVKSYLKALIFAAIFLLTWNFALAATITISDSETKSANTDFTNGDDANFTGNGTLNADATRSLTTIATTTTNTGNINFTTANTLTSTGGIGASNFSLRNINFQNDGTLEFNGNLYVGTQGITTTTTNQGNLTLTGTNQTISPNIGTANLRLKTITINSGASFEGAVYANQLRTNSDGSTISGTGLLNFSISNFTNTTTLSSTGSISLGTTSLSDSKTLTINSDASIGGLTAGTTSDSTISIASGKNLTFSGNITGMGIARGATSGVGDISFIGSTAQTVSSTYQLGDSSNRLGKLTINNAAGVSFANDAYISSLAFTQSSGSSTLNIASTKILDISGDVSNTSNSSGSIIKGAGSVNLTGATTQTIATSFGASASDRLGTLLINNSATGTTNVSLGKAYLNNLNIGSSDTSILVNNSLDTSNFNATQNVTFSGSGSISLGATSLANAKTLTLNSDASMISLASGDATSTISIASGKTLSVSGNITGTGIAKGATSGVGNVSFNGSTAQTVSSTYQLGDSSNRLGTLSISNNAGVSFDNDAYISSLAFNQTSGTSTLTIASGKTIDLTGNVSTANTSSTSIITGSGSILLAGTSSQTIAASFGASATNRLGTLTINNSGGVVLSRNNYLNNLTISNGQLSIAGSTTTDVVNAVDLSSKTVSFAVDSDPNPFAKIKTAAGVTIDSSTAFNIDYSKLKANLSFDSGTTYNIIESGTGITGNTASVKLSDNSFLMNSELVASGNNIAVKLISDSNNFSESNLGQKNYSLVLNAINHSDLNAGLISIASLSDLQKAIETMKPMNNAAGISSVINSNSNLLRIASSRGSNYSSDKFDYKKNIWGTTFGSYLSQNKRDGAIGYKQGDGGLAFGLEEAANDNSVFGAAFAYSKSLISADLSSTNDLKIDNYQLAFYNNNSFHSSKPMRVSPFSKAKQNFEQKNFGFYNSNSLVLAFNQFNSDRQIRVGSFNKTATSSHFGNSQQARIGIGYNKKLTESFIIDPNAAVEFFNLSQNSYQEKGAGNAGLKVKNSNLSGFYTDLGVDFSILMTTENHLFAPKLRLNWRRAGSNYRQKSKIAFIGGGSEIDNSSISLQQNQFETGLGLDIDDGKNNFVQIQLDGKFADGLIGGGLSGRYIYLF